MWGEGLHLRPEFGRENVSVTRREEATFQGLGSAEPWEEKDFSPSFFFLLEALASRISSTLELAAPLLLNPHYLFPVSLCNQHTVKGAILWHRSSALSEEQFFGTDHQLCLSQAEDSLQDQKYYEVADNST